jgi:creatinine amidohydrolase
MMSSMDVEHLTWPEYKAAIASRVLVLPIGALDAHGPHLPLCTDTIISTYLARKLGEQIDVLVLPALTYGQKTDPPAGGGEFPGVTNLSSATMTAVVLDVLRASYRQGARRFLLVDSHKANFSAVREAAHLFFEGTADTRLLSVMWWDLVSEQTRNEIAAETGVGRHDDHHAGMVETSLVMHIAANLVRAKLLADDVPTRRARYLVLPVPDDLKTRTGVVYRASKASSAIGERVLREVEANLVAAVRMELLA